MWTFKQRTERVLGRAPNEAALVNYNQPPIIRVIVAFCSLILESPIANDAIQMLPMEGIDDQAYFDRFDSHYA